MRKAGDWEIKIILQCGARVTEDISGAEGNEDPNGSRGTRDKMQPEQWSHEVKEGELLSKVEPMDQRAEVKSESLKLDAETGDAPAKMQLVAGSHVNPHYQVKLTEGELNNKDQWRLGWRIGLYLDKRRERRTWICFRRFRAGRWRRYRRLRASQKKGDKGDLADEGDSEDSMLADE